jgi:hypothetical protein
MSSGLVRVFRARPSDVMGRGSAGEVEWAAVAAEEAERKPLAGALDEG